MNIRRPLATQLQPSRLRVIMPTTDTFSDDIDWIAVERTVTGDGPRPELNLEERRHAVLLLARAGATEDRIHQLTGVDRRQISRWKFENGLSKARTCAVKDCGQQVKSRGLCDNHYRQDKRASEATGLAPRGPRRPARCGTRPGYKRHHREGTPVCDACAQANRAYANQRLKTLKDAA